MGHIRFNLFVLKCKKREFMAKKVDKTLSYFIFKSKKAHNNELFLANFI